MIIYKRQTRQMFHFNNPKIYSPDAPLNEWQDDDSFFHADLEQKLNKENSFIQGYTYTEERFVPIGEEKNES